MNNLRNPRVGLRLTRLAAVLTGLAVIGWAGAIYVGHAGAADEVRPWMLGLAALAALLAVLSTGLLYAALRRTRRVSDLRLAELAKREADIMRIEYRTRRRIGQDIHDGLCQILTGVSMLCGLMRQRLAEKSHPELSTLTEMEQHISEAVTEAYHLARGLNPVRMGNRGLVDALKELALHTRNLHSVVCDFYSNTDEPVNDPAVATHLYRIAQEAVSNAVKHGRAEHVWIHLLSGGPTLTLTVRDDGLGLPEESTDVQGIGIRGMKYRATAMGAAFSIRRGSRGGAVVTCIVPTRNRRGMIRDDQKE